MKKASEQQADNLLAEALDMFRCYRDLDIEQFLRKKAIDFEKRGYCTVYLILNEEAFDRGQIVIIAYFTLSHKSIGIIPGVSKTIRGKIAGKKDAGLAHFVLIGQLGKYITKDKCGDKYTTDITSEDILNDAFTIIEKASDFIVCRGVLVECSSEKKVHMIYKNYGFSYLQYDEEHYQFYKRVSNKLS